MPMLIDGVPCPENVTVDEFVHLHPQFKSSSKVFLEQEVKTVGPEKLVYVGQREVAYTTPDDGSGATSLIHFDGSQIDKGLHFMTITVADLSKNSSSGRLELHLFGGFLDDKKNSEEVSDSILAALRKTKHDIHLITACITHHNTVYRDSVPFPVIYGIAVNVKTGEMFQATFPDKGPDMSLRCARHFTGGSENLNIYDPVSKELVIPPFHYARFDDVDLILSLSNHVIRKHMSTSPQQEKEDFADNIRATLKHLRDFPDPIKTVFTGGLPRRYRKENTNGAWVKIE